MTRSQVYWFWFWAFWLYLFEVSSNLFYRIMSEVFSVSFSNDTWTDFLLSVLLLLCSGAYISLFIAPKGIISIDGIKIGRDKLVPLDNVERIVNDGYGYPSVIITTAGQKKAWLGSADYARLAITRLKQWVIKSDKIEVTTKEQEFSAKYSRLGKYQTFRLDMANNLIAIAAVILMLARKGFDEAFNISLGLLAISYTYYYINEKYKRVEVTIEGETVRIIDSNKAERSFRFSEVDKVERDFFQTKATLKSGEAVYFPQACIILPELIEEFRTQYK
jgi:hypothetical protein